MRFGLARQGPGCLRATREKVGNAEISRDMDHPRRHEPVISGINIDGGVPVALCVQRDIGRQALIPQ
jgi:hypothetical protein